MSKVEVVRRDYATSKTEVLHTCRTSSAACRWLDREGWRHVGSLDDEPTRVLYEVEEGGNVVVACAPCNITEIEEISGLWTGRGRNIKERKRKMIIISDDAAAAIRSGVPLEASR